MTTHDLRPLGDVAGTWTGEGLSVLAQPDAGAGGGWSLEVKRTHEGIAFADIGALAGMYRGVYYLHHITERASRETLLIGPGMWLILHARPEAAKETNVARLATLGEGHAVLADGTSVTTPGGPQIDPASPTPIDLTSARPLAGERAHVGRGEGMPAGAPADVLSDVNTVLRRQIEDQRVLSTTTMTIANRPGIEQRLQGMPFSARNPESLGLQASFWVETLADPRRTRARASPASVQPDRSARARRRRLAPHLPRHARQAVAVSSEEK